MIVVVDTETTGLDNSVDEILQLSIIDYFGRTLYNSYFKPVKHTEWLEAERVNGISPEMVADAPLFSDELPKITAILMKAHAVVGYNTQFDVDFLKAAGASLPNDIEYVDVMREFAPVYGEWSEERQCFKWKKLIVCAEYYGYDWRKDSAHNSLSDCRATLYCYKKLKQQQRKKPCHRIVKHERKAICSVTDSMEETM